MTQRTQILAWLKHQSITPRDAMEFGCYRLAARIMELRAAGYDIETRMEPHQGGKHARYLLKGKNDVEKS